MHAAQACAFNAVLSRRLELGCLDRFVSGDLANLHPGRSIFRVTEAMLADAAEADRLSGRLAAFDCSPTGPLPGSDVMAVESQAAEIERSAMSGVGIDPSALERPENGVPGERRSLRMRVSDPHVEAGVDDHGGYIRLAFDLPRGGYATTVLSELFDAGPEVEAAEES